MRPILKFFTFFTIFFGLCACQDHWRHQKLWGQQGYVHDHYQDYQYEKENEIIILPPSLEAKSTDEFYPIPEVLVKNASITDSLAAVKKQNYKNEVPGGEKG